MSDSEKSVWEEKCKKMNKEVAARMAAENADNKNDRWVIQHVLKSQLIARQLFQQRDKKCF